MSLNLVCLGERLYKVDHLDLNLPAQLSLEGLSDVAILDDQIVILLRNPSKIIVFDYNGRFKLACQLRECRTGHGLRLIGDRQLAITDMDGHCVFVLDHNFKVVQRLSPDGVPRFCRPFNHPADCTQDVNGNFYVADGYGNSMVHVFDSSGAHVNSFGQPGSGPGEFSTPHSILIDQKDRLCVADRENNRVQRFDLDGRYLDEISGLHKPMALAELDDGTLLCSDQTPRLSAYSSDGQLTGRCRTYGTYGHGLAVSKDDTIVIAEMIPDRVSVLKPYQAP